MIYTLQESSKTNGITLTFDTKEDILDAISVLIGNPGLHKLTLSWEPTGPLPKSVAMKTVYPEQDCAITDNPPPLEKIPGIEKDSPISSIEEIKPKPAPKKKGMKKQASITDDDASYKNILNQNTRLGDGGDFENITGRYD